MNAAGDRPPDPAVKAEDGHSQKTGLPPSVRTLIALAVCGGALYYAYLEIWKHQNPVPAAALALRSSNPEHRLTAVQNLAELGLKRTKEAVPSLIGALGDSDENVRAAAARALAVMSCYDLQSTGDVESARTAANALLGSLKDASPGVRIEAARALLDLSFSGSAPAKAASDKQRGSSVAPVELQTLSATFEKMLDDPDERVRVEALRGLGKVAPVLSGEPHEALVAALENASPTVRAIAVGALGESWRGLDPVVPTLTRMLEHDESPEVRDACGATLIALRPSALSAAAVPTLVAASQLKNPTARFQVISLLARLESNARRAAIPAFIAALKEPIETDQRGGGGVRSTVTGPVYVAAEALGKSAPGTSSAQEAVAALLVLAQSGSLARAAAAAGALGQFGKEAEPAAPVLARILKESCSSKEVMREGAAFAVALGKIAKGTRSAPEAASALAEALDAQAEFTREAAIGALASLGPQYAAGARARVSALEKDDPSPRVRSAAKSFLERPKPDMTRDQAGSAPK
jgi:HEAT repeat protein